MLSPELWATIESAATTVALFVGGLWGYKLFRQKRQRFPRARVSQDLVAWPATSSVRLVRVSVKIENAGEVLIRLRSGFTWVQQIRPVPSNLRSALAAGKQVTAEGKFEADWPIIAETRWDNCPCEIEPSESDEIHFDFTIPLSVTTIQVYTHLENRAKRRWLSWRAPKQIGWNSTSVFDLPYPLEECTMESRDPLPRPQRPTEPDTHRQGPPRDRPQTPHPTHQPPNNPSVPRQPERDTAG